jgi:hypothetical protein
VDILKQNGTSRRGQEFTLGYAMRLDRGTGTEFSHSQVPVTLPDGSIGSMAIHVINGTPDKIKAQLLESVDAFFEIYAADATHESGSR